LPSKEHAARSGQTEKSFRKLRKSLKNVPKQPSPEEVRDLRTKTRRLESTLHALMLDHKQDGQRLLAIVSSIGKKAACSKSHLQREVRGIR
jgi:CHAD domain-containing protein